MDRFLTTKELADLLRLKERKVYDMAAAGEVPCTRATGKLLFPRDAVDAWLAEHTETGGLAATKPRPGVVLGSHDPLIEWALRECRSGLASYFDSSRDGLERFAAGEGIATGLHLYCPDSDNWNVSFVSSMLGGQAIVLIEWAKRQRGLIVAEGNPLGIASIADLRGKKVVPRQATAGSQVLFDHLIAAAEFGTGDFVLTNPALSEADAVLAVQEGKADAAFGLGALAGPYQLDFVPLAEERFDLLVDRRSYFEPPLQSLFTFTRTKAFADKARDLSGYDVSRLGTVHFNGQ
ncbi:MAG: helix-turn-helix transcriptional regulator [Alphaproteobacteria bacterium]|nr:helix-turn-helix transcriptional regulator [Alphaproteobacteria bacterium]